jgi:hypothetical protein
VNAGRENAGEARLVAGIASGLAEPKTVYWSSRSLPQLLAAFAEDVRSLFGVSAPRRARKAGARRAYKPEVVGSNPTPATRRKPSKQAGFLHLCGESTSSKGGTLGAQISEALALQGAASRVAGRSALVTHG